MINEAFDLEDGRNLLDWEMAMPFIASHLKNDPNGFQTSDFLSPNSQYKINGKTLGLLYYDKFGKRLTKNTLLRCLKTLHRMGYVRIVGKGNNVRYVWKEFFSATYIKRKLYHSQHLFDEIEKGLPLNKEYPDSSEDIKKLLPNTAGTALLINFFIPYHTFYFHSYKKDDGRLYWFLTKENERSFFETAKIIALLYTSPFSQYLIKHLGVTPPSRTQLEKLDKKYMNVFNNLQNELRKLFLEDMNIRYDAEDVRDFATDLIMGLLSLSHVADSRVRIMEKPKQFANQKFRGTFSRPDVTDFVYYPILSFSIAKWNILKERRRIPRKLAWDSFYRMVCGALKGFGEDLRAIWNETRNYVKELTQFFTQYKEAKLELWSANPLPNTCPNCPKPLENMEDEELEVGLHNDSLFTAFSSIRS